MFCVLLRATNSSFQKGMTFCRSIYVKKVMKLLVFIFEQPSYILCEYMAFHRIANKFVIRKKINRLRGGANMETWPRGYKTFFILNSAEHEIYPANKC